MTEFPPIKSACMGGWCTKRDRCDAHLQDDRRHVAERLCPAGQPATSQAERTAAHKAALAKLPAFAQWAAMDTESTA